MIKKVSAFLIASVLMLPILSFAQESSDQQVTNTLDEIVVTAGRVEEEKKFVVANVTVIDEQEIKQLSALNLGELLAQKGIGSVKQYPGDLTSIGIRGFRTETHGNDLEGHVLILLNGRRAGTGNVAKIMTKNVERIEIIRGPASVQYGSAAMGGVVNVITRRGEGKTKGFGEFSLGSFKSKEVSAGLSGEVNGFDFSSAATGGSIGDYTTGHGVEYENTAVDMRKSLSMNLGYTFLTNNRIGFIYNGFDVDGAGSPGYLSSNDLDDYTDKSNSSFDLILDGKTVDKRFLWSARYFKGKDKNTWADPTASNPDGWGDGILSQQETKTKGAQAQVTANRGIAQMTAGVDWINYKIDGTWQPQESSYENMAGFLLGKVKIFDERLVLSAGLRYDTYEVEVIKPAGQKEDDTNFTPNVGIAFLLTDNLKLKAGYSHAFVMPSADQMAADYTSSWGTIYEGNPDLQPETSKTYEGGFEFYKGSFSSGLTYFYTDFKDKIESVTKSNGNKSWDNLGRAVISGFEGEMGFDLGDYLGWGFEIRPFVGFTYLTRYEDKETGEDLLETSNLSAAYGILFSDFKGFSVRLNFAYSGEKTVTDYENKSYQRVKLKAFTVADLGVSKLLFSSKKGGQVTLNAGINNLFDSEYEYVQGYPMPGRNIYAGLRYDY
ncbi:MAG: TonB-dependent receptor [Desulfobacteraceae bacterium]|nr:TonB-dependent receptor [Desulfobacteraceae bacterium]